MHAPALAASVLREIVSSPLRASVIPLSATSLAAPAVAPRAAAAAAAPSLAAAASVRRAPSAERSLAPPAARSLAAPADAPAVAAAVSPPAPVALLSSTFKLVFLSVLFLTVACGAAQVVMASIWSDPSDNQQDAFEAMGFAWKAGLGSIFGLLGGKVA